MDVIINGIVREVLPLQQGVSQKSGKTWQSQDFLLEHEGGQYPKNVCFKVFGQDKIQQFAIREGEQLTVHLNIEAKRGQKGYFNDIQCWKVERQAQQMSAQQPVQYPAQAPMQYAQPQPQMYNQPGMGNNPGVIYPNASQPLPQVQAPTPGSNDLPF